MKRMFKFLLPYNQISYEPDFEMISSFSSLISLILLSGET